MPQGLPLRSRLLSIVVASVGNGGLDQDLVAAHAVDVVDVLDVDRALFDAGAAVGAGPQHLGVDDAVLTSGSPTSGRAASASTSAGRCSRSSSVASRYGALAKAWSRRSRMSCLGDSGLPVDPGRALRLAAAALGAGAQVEQALPGQVLDLPDAEHVGVRVGLLEVEDLAVRTASARAGRGRSGGGRT